MRLLLYIGLFILFCAGPAWGTSITNIGEAGGGGGSGDVTSVGDCASGACYDGSSDGGTYARLYDGDSNYMQLDVEDVSADYILSLPTTIGTATYVLQSDGDNTTSWVDIVSTYQTVLTNSAGLAAALSDETGTGVAVFATSPTFVTPTLGVATATSLTIGASASPQVSFKDSDAPGTDKDVGNIKNVYVDGADGSENADMGFYITQGGTEDTLIMLFDESDDQWETDKDILSTAEIRGGVFTVSYAANQTLSVDECKGGTVYVTGASTMTLPAIFDGASVTVHTVGAIAVSVDTNASDKMVLDGTTLDDGDKATNTSTAGDTAVCKYYSADGWYCSTNAWTDGGA